MMQEEITPIDTLQITKIQQHGTFLIKMAHHMEEEAVEKESIKNSAFEINRPLLILAKDNRPPPFQQMRIWIIAQ